MRYTKWGGMWESYINTHYFLHNMLRMKCHPLEEVICMQLAMAEWAKEPACTIPYRMETYNTTLATIFEW